MTTSTENIFHKNGQLSYTETIVILDKETAHLYPNRITHPKGYDWIRVGKNEKYFADGRLAWCLNYDDKGNVIM